LFIDNLAHLGFIVHYWILCIQKSSFGKSRQQELILWESRVVGPLPSFLAIAGESVSSCTLAFHQLAMALKTPKLLAAFVTESFFAKAITFSFWDVVYDILIAFNYPLCIWPSCSDHHPANMIGQFHYPTLCLLGEISHNHAFGPKSSINDAVFT